MDGWDDVVNYEENEYEKGVQDGIVDGMKSGFEEDGFRAGFMKGYAYAIELGYYETAVFYYLSRGRNESIDLPETVEIEDSTPVHAIISSTTLPSSSSVDRIEKRSQLLLQKIALLKSSNDKEIDYDTELQSIRSLYKSLNLRIGAFLPSNHYDIQSSATKLDVNDDFNNSKQSTLPQSMSW